MNGLKNDVGLPHINGLPVPDSPKARMRGSATSNPRESHAQDFPAGERHCRTQEPSCNVYVLAQGLPCSKQPQGRTDRPHKGESVQTATHYIEDRRAPCSSSVRSLSHTSAQAHCAAEDLGSGCIRERHSLPLPVSARSGSHPDVSQNRSSLQAWACGEVSTAVSVHVHAEMKVRGQARHRLEQHSVPQRSSTFIDFQSTPRLDPMRFAHQSPDMAHCGLLRRFRACTVGAVCEGVEGGTAFEQPHVYARPPEEDLLWEDAAYADSMMHQNGTSRASRRVLGANTSVPCFKPVAQTIRVRTSTDRCATRSCAPSHTQLGQNRMIWDKRGACAEATEHSRDGSNESDDDLGFTTPASPEDLAYDEAQAIDSVFRQRSGSGGNQLLAYSRAVAAAQDDPADLPPAITPRAFENGAVEKASNELLQQSACSPVSPSCVAQLLVNDSHVYLRVRESEDAAVPATDTEARPPVATATNTGTNDIDTESSQGLKATGTAQDVGKASHEALAERVGSQKVPVQHLNDSQERGSGVVDSISAPQEPADESAIDSVRVQGEDTGGGLQDNIPRKSGEIDSPTNTFARALSLSLRRLSQSMNRVINGQPVNHRDVQAHVCERLARKGQHVLALAEAFAQVGLAERLPAGMIVSTAPPSFWPSIAVVHKLSKHILEHSTAAGTSEAGNGLSTCSAQTAPAVPHLRTAVASEFVHTYRAAEVQTARPVNQGGRHARQRSQPVVVDFPRQLPDEQHTFRFRKGFNVFDSAAEEESEDIVLYTSSIASLRKTAADTRRMRQILDAFQVNYQEVDLALQPRMRRRMLEISDDFNVLPQLHCRGKLIGDGDTCFDLHDFGELMPILINGDDPCGPEEEEEQTESPASSEDATGVRHIFKKHSSASCDSSSQGPREFELMELPSDLLQKLQACVESAALQACLKELPPETGKEDADSAQGRIPSASVCALTGLPCGDWKVDHVEVSFAGSQTILSEEQLPPRDAAKGRTVVIAAAANLWLSLVDEELPCLSRSS